MTTDLATGRTDHDANGGLIVECLCPVCGETWWASDCVRPACDNCGYYTGAHKVEVPEHVLSDAMQILFAVQTDEAMACRAEIGNAMREAYSRK